MARPSQIPEVGFPAFCSELLLGLLQEMERAGEKSDGDVDDDGDGCGEFGFRNFYQYCRHLLGPGDDSVEDFNMKWVTLE